MLQQHSQFTTWYYLFYPAQSAVLHNSYPAQSAEFKVYITSL